MVQLDGQTIFYDMIRTEEPLSIESIHSVSLNPVTNYYLINHEGITSTGTHFLENGGAGLPDVLNAAEEVTITEVGVEITKNEYLTDSLKLIVNEKSDWNMTIRDVNIDLSNTNATKKVEINVAKHNMIMFGYYKVMVLINEI
jgi:hypothetical protein